MTAETYYKGKLLRTDYYMTERQWMDHVERHAAQILKRYLKRKLKMVILNAQLVGIILSGIAILTLVTGLCEKIATLI